MHGTGKPLGRFSEEVPVEARDAATLAAEVLQKATRVLVLGHRGADGDVAGSSLALALALREQGKSVTVYNEEIYGEGIDWLPHAADVVTKLPANARYDATVVVDAADPARCGADFPPASRRGVFIWIDHHRIDEPPGDINYVDLTAAAVGEQIAEILDAMAHPISKDVAVCLYTSLMSDTGGFRYANTSARALRLAGRLVAAGVEPWEITQQLYESQPVPKLRLLARALSSLELSPGGKVGLVSLSAHDVERAGADEKHLHGIVNHVRGIRGVEIAILAREVGEDVELVLRSSGNVSVAKIAALLGATGNLNAARFRLRMGLHEAEERVLRSAAEVAEAKSPATETLARVQTKSRHQKSGKTRTRGAASSQQNA